MIHRFPRNRVPSWTVCTLSLSLLFTTVHSSCFGEPQYYIEEDSVIDCRPLYIIAGVAAIVAAGSGGYAAGRYRCKEGERGPRGSIGPMGDEGKKGDSGNNGPQGAHGLAGSQGDRGPKGNKGVPGPSFTFPTGPDELSFFFNNGAVGKGDLEVMVGVVTTPSQQQFLTDPISEGSGSFPSISPIGRAPIGVYHLTLLPSVGGVNTSSSVMVFKNGALFTTLPYATGDYESQAQLTLEFIYQP